MITTKRLFGMRLYVKILLSKLKPRTVALKKRTGYAIGYKMIYFVLMICIEFLLSLFYQRQIKFSAQLSELDCSPEIVTFPGIAVFD